MSRELPATRRPPGTQSSPDTVADLVFGTIWYRMLATDRPLDEDLAHELVDLFAPHQG